MIERKGYKEWLRRKNRRNGWQEGWLEGRNREGKERKGKERKGKERIEWMVWEKGIEEMVGENKLLVNLNLIEWKKDIAIMHGINRWVRGENERNSDK